MASLPTSDLIQLPRLSAPEAASLLGEMLHTAADLAPLPAGIERSRKRLAAALAELDSSITGISVDAADAERQRVADRAIDNAWEATFLWLSGFCKLPDGANANLEAARALYAQVFPDGIAFTKLPYKVQWSESKARLDSIANEGKEQTFAALGGSSFLTELYRTHKAYEEALRPLLEADLDPKHSHGELAAASVALRQYVSRVVSYADPNVSGSEVLANALLAPLSRWYRLHPSSSPDMSSATPEDVEDSLMG